jgi:predicted DNA-binding transcriptional regulator AlpA
MTHRVAGLGTENRFMLRQVRPIETAESTDRLLSVSQVANLLAISTRTVWRMRDSGQLPQPIRVSRNLLRWRLSDIQNYMQIGTPGR